MRNVHYRTREFQNVIFDDAETNGLQRFMVPHMVKTERCDFMKKKKLSHAKADNILLRRLYIFSNLPIYYIKLH